MATDPEVRVRFPVLPDFLRSSGSLYPQKVGTNFADKRRSLGQYSSETQVFTMHELPYTVTSLVCEQMYFKQPSPT
jgi:hypothetical protein